MEYKDVIDAARGNVGPYCKACLICNGVACKNIIPGPGAKGAGTVAIRNYNKWQEIHVSMDTIYKQEPTDISFKAFGKTFAAPIFAAPIGDVKRHYSDEYTDIEYNTILLNGCAKSNIAAFTGDGIDPAMFKESTDVIKSLDGNGIPTIKPWDMPTVHKKLELAKASGAFAIAMDIDAAGLPFLQNLNPPAGSKSVEELQEISSAAGVPFILKGIMSAKAARKAYEAGAAGIVVSNHGGRVLDGCLSTAEVLPEIVNEVGGKLTIFVDGGLRCGLDIFKALAIGADAVLVGRPFATSIYGAAEDGIESLVNKLKAELIDTMKMCGANSLSEISNDMVRL